MSNEGPEEKKDDLIHIHIKIAKPDSPKVVVVQHEDKSKAVGDATASKVKKFGSELEKDAVNAVGGFKRKGFFVKDSRSS